MHWPWSHPPVAQPDATSVAQPDATLLARLQALERHQEQPKDPSLLARVEELEDTAKRLERRFVKLQGEFSAYQRDYYAEPEYDDDDDRDLPQVRQA